MGWVKCNMDEVAKLSSSLASCGRIFRNHHASMLGCFAFSVSIKHALFVELMTIVKAIEIANCRVLNHLWPECNSLLVVKVFKDDNLVPWKLGSRWWNAVVMPKSMNLIVGHIYHEGNTRADRLAAYVTLLNDFLWWDYILCVINRQTLFYKFR